MGTKSGVLIKKFSEALPRGHSFTDHDMKLNLKKSDILANFMQ